MKQYEKLIRDKVPEIIEEEGKQYSVRKLDKEEYRKALTQKLQEEVEEFIDEPKLEELADILEVIRFWRQAHDISRDMLENVRERKYKERGGFEKRLFLEWVKEED